MKVDRVFVLSYLKEKQIAQGGYYGSDLSNLAKVMKVTYRAVRMRLTKGIKEDPDFFNLIYLGKPPPSITLDEFIEIKDRIQSNPLELKKHMLSDIRDKRELRGEDTSSRATFYRRANQVELSLFTNNECYRWFSERKIKIPSFYSVKDERESLSNVFHFYNLKAYGGADIEAIYERFKEAKEWFSRYEVDPMRFYPALLTKGTKLRSLLTSIRSRTSYMHALNIASIVWMHHILLSHGFVLLFLK
jgi:hypothetical protein